MSPAHPLFAAISAGPAQEEDGQCFKFEMIVKISPALDVEGIDNDMDAKGLLVLP